MDYKNIPLNAIPSPEDQRDFLISRLIAKVNVFPDEFEIVYNYDILNQGNVSSCVPHSIEGYCRSITEEKQSGIYQLFSPGFRYGLRDSDDYKGAGMYPREALDSALKFGSVPYNVFPYNEEYDLVKARIEKDKDNLLTIAEEFKISAYCRLYTVDEIKNALIQLGMVTICIPIYESFYDTGSDGLVKNPDINNEELYGYHEVTIYGWRKDNKWGCLNSWSDGWGDKGKFYINFDFPITEAWSITDNIEPHPEPEPEKQLYYRVQLFAFKNKDNAINATILLKTQGFNTYIVELDGYFKIQCGAFVNPLNSSALAEQLKSFGYKPWIIYY